MTDYQWTTTIIIPDIFGSPGADADCRAQTLLRSHLTQSQRDSLDTNGYFEVVGNATGTTYRIKQRHTLTQRNVVSMAHGKENLAYDAAPMMVRGSCLMRLPSGDVLLAQKLCLETDEINFLSTACSAPAEIADFGMWIETQLARQQIIDRNESFWRSYFR